MIVFDKSLNRDNQAISEPPSLELHKLHHYRMLAFPLFILRRVTLAQLMGILTLAILWLGAVVTHRQRVKMQQAIESGARWLDHAMVEDPTRTSIQHLADGFDSSRWNIFVPANHDAKLCVVGREAFQPSKNMIQETNESAHTTFPLAPGTHRVELKDVYTKSRHIYALIIDGQEAWKAQSVPAVGWGSSSAVLPNRENKNPRIEILRKMRFTTRSAEQPGDGDIPGFTMWLEMSP